MQKVATSIVPVHGRQGGSSVRRSVEESNKPIKQLFLFKHFCSLNLATTETMNHETYAVIGSLRLLASICCARVSPEEEDVDDVDTGALEV